MKRRRKPQTYFRSKQLFVRNKGLAKLIFEDIRKTKSGSYTGWVLGGHIKKR